MPEGEDFAGLTRFGEARMLISYSSNELKFLMECDKATSILIPSTPVF